MEQKQSHYEHEPTSDSLLDREAIIAVLSELSEEFGLDIDLDSKSDLELMLGEDDTDFLSNLASLAMEYEVDYEDFFKCLRISLE